MLNKLPKTLTKISDYSVVVFLFLFPIYFLPFTYDLFELNKSILMVVFAVWFLILVGVRSVINKSFTLTTSYLTFPIILLALAYLVASAFSFSTTYSWWGFYGFLGNSLPVNLAMLSLVITIPSLVSNLYTVKKAFVALSVSFFIVVLTSFISFFQFVPASRLIVFLSSVNGSLVGGFIFLKYFLVIAAFLFSFAVLNVRRKQFEFFYFVSLLLTLVLSALILDKLMLAFVLVSTVLPLGILKAKFVKAKMSLVLFASLIFVALSVVVNIPQVATALNMSSRIPQTANVGFMDSWLASSRGFGQRPFFGFGPSTFISVFAFFKPQSVNGTLFWDTLFVKPFSYYMLILTELGLVGVAAFGFLLFKLVRSLFNKVTKTDENYANYSLALKSLAFVILVCLLTTAGNVFIVGSLFITLALAVSFEKFMENSRVEEMSINMMGELSHKNQTSSLISAMSTVFSIYKVYVVAVILVLLFSLNFVYRVMAADIAFLSFFRQPKTLLDVTNNYINAAKINPRNDFYQKNIIQMDRSIATIILNDLAKKKDVSKDDKAKVINDVNNLFKDARARAEFITAPDSGLNINVQNWEAKGLLYQGLMGLADKSDVLALEAYSQAAARNPLNPRILASAGNVYFFEKKFQEASNVYYKAVQLKTDYAVPRYNLAKSLEQLKQYDNAIVTAKSILNIVKKDSKDYALVEKYIKELEDAKAKAGTSSTDTTNPKLNIDENTPKTAPTVQPKLTEPNEPLQEGSTTNPEQAPVVAPTPLTKGTLPNQTPVKAGEKGYMETPSTTPSATKSVMTPAPTK